MKEIDGLEKWYLPNWEDDLLWKYKWNRHVTSDSKQDTSLKKKYPTSESFKSYCYRQAEESKFSQCNASSGWCQECGFNSEWDSELPNIYSGKINFFRT